VPTTIRSGNVYFFRDGKISAVDSYYEASEALEAVGLSEWAMSQENVEIVKTFLRPEGTDYTELFGDDALWAANKDAVEPLLERDFAGTFVAWGQRAEFAGLDGLREAFRDWLSPWRSYYDEIQDVFAVGDDRVVVLGRQHGYRLDTEAEVVSHTAGVYLVRDGKIARVEYYATQAEALAAVGLSEQDAHADS
jgi:ketosteroid isomerase-like protein